MQHDDDIKPQKSGHAKETHLTTGKWTMADHSYPSLPKTWQDRRCSSTRIYGDFHNWGYPKMDGLYGKCPLKWMIWGSPHLWKPPYIKMTQEKHQPSSIHPSQKSPLPNMNCWGFCRSHLPALLMRPACNGNGRWSNSMETTEFFHGKNHRTSSLEHFLARHVAEYQRIMSFSRA